MLLEVLLIALELLLEQVTDLVGVLALLRVDCDPPGLAAPQSARRGGRV